MNSKEVIFLLIHLHRGGWASTLAHKNVEVRGCLENTDVCHAG